MLASNETALRRFFARFLGWADEHKDDIEHAVRSTELAATHRAALLVVVGTSYRSIHRDQFGYLHRDHLAHPVTYAKKGALRTKLDAAADDRAARDGTPMLAPVSGGAP